MTSPVRPPCGLGRMLASVSLFLAMVACQPPRTDPEEALRTFLSDLRNGRADAAWAALSTASQRELERRHALLSPGEQDAAPRKPAQLLFEDLGLMMVSAPETIAVASPPGQDVMLRVSVKDGRSADIHMVREGERWKIDLFASLHPAPPLEARLGEKPTTDTATVP